MWVLGLRSQHVRRKPLLPPCELWGPKSASAWPAKSTYQPLRFISWTHRSQHSAKHCVQIRVSFVSFFSFFEDFTSLPLWASQVWDSLTTTGLGRNVTCLGNLLGFLGLLPCDPMRQTLKWLWRKDPWGTGQLTPPGCQLRFSGEVLFFSAGLVNNQDYDIKLHQFLSNVAPVAVCLSSRIPHWTVKDLDKFALQASSLSLLSPASILILSWLNTRCLARNLLFP